MHFLLRIVKMENPWVAEYPKMLPPPRGDPRFGILPPRRAFWRRTAGGDFFLADESNAIPANRVQKDDLETIGTPEKPRLLVFD